MIHDDNIPHYGKDWTTLAETLGDLRYDALAEFLEALSEKMAKDAEADAGRARHQLARELYDCAEQLGGASGATKRAWKICARFMDGEEEA